jgi:ureidoglycolate lyase
MQLTERELTAEAFAPYGAVIQRPGSGPEASGPGWSWWSETVQLSAMDRPYAAGYLDLEPRPLRFNWAERHAHSAEVIIPLGGDVLIYVAAPEPDRFDVFRVRSGQGVVLDAGVWHGAPLAIDGPLSAIVLLRQGTGLEDREKVTFAPIEAMVEPDTRD